MSAIYEGILHAAMALNHMADGGATRPPGMAIESSAVKSGYCVGESMISGVLCDHLALRGEKEDVQVWIARGDEPVPRRIVITYRELEGQPQFWAQFTEWDFSPELSDTTFTFSLPEGAERIHFFADMPGEESK